MAGEYVTKIKIAFEELMACPDGAMAGEFKEKVTTGQMSNYKLSVSLTASVEAEVKGAVASAKASMSAGMESSFETSFSSSREVEKCFTGEVGKPFYVYQSMITAFTSEGRELRFGGSLRAYSSPQQLLHEERVEPPKAATVARRRCRILSAKNPSKCIHLKSGNDSSSNGDACHLWDVRGGSYPAQEWIIEGRLIKSVKMPGKCIHLASGGGRSSNGDKCHLWDINGGSYPAQEWIIEGKLIKSVKEPGKCIHLASGNDSSSNGDK